jgi:flagellar biosynthetic protein FlhB
MPMFDQARVVLGRALGSDDLSDPIQCANSWELILYLGSSAVRIGGPILLIFWGASFLAQFSQVGWLFSSKAIRPNLNKLNPMSGLKRIFGLSGLVKSAVDPMKVALVVLMTAITMSQYAESIVVLPYLEPLQSLAIGGNMLFDLALRVAAVLLVLGIIDYLYQRWKHDRDLRMTKQQVKDEMKQAEGDPEVKRRRLRIQQQLAMQRISTAVPKADVIVTNPEHISIAIQYDPARMNAPKVVAKGADFLAMRIRQIAMAHGIPIVERKPLARALYREVAVNQEVPPTFYKAVAEILAYVYRLTGKAVA